MGRVRDWFSEHPPSAWVVCLETTVKALNGLLLLLGLAVFAWSIATVVQIQNEPNSPEPAPAPSPVPGLVTAPALLPLQLLAQDSNAPVVAAAAAGSKAAVAAASTPLAAISHTTLMNMPWFIFVFGALGAATAFCATMALLGVRLRSLGCMNGHIFCMCLLLTGQACAAVAFFVDAGWEQRLPDIDEKLKRFLAERLQVCKWLGLVLALLQLLTLLLSCWLQAAYVRAEEAAEDADEEAAWHRRPLLQAQARRQQQQPPSRGSSPVASGPGAAADDDGWSERMQQQYGLDTSQFGYRPGSRGAAAGEAGGQQAESRKGCVVM